MIIFGILLTFTIGRRLAEGKVSPDKNQRSSNRYGRDMVLDQGLDQFHSYLTIRHIVVKRICPQNFIKIKELKIIILYILGLGKCLWPEAKVCSRNIFA